MKNNVHRLLCSESEKGDFCYRRRYSQAYYESYKTAEMGVSATHLDWTMVPYVRKSFYKHYKDGLRYIEKLSNQVIEREIFLDKKYNIINISIIDRDAYIYENAYQYALDQTEKEIHQAVEGLYHNLNTLQSRSGN